MRMMLLLCLIAAPVAGAPAGAALREDGGSLVFGNGVVELRLDAATGAWRSFSRVGEPPVLGQDGSAGTVRLRSSQGWLLDDVPSRRLSHRTEVAGNATALIVTRRQGDWEIADRYELRPGLDLLARSATVTLRAGKPVEVGSMRFALTGARVGDAADCRFIIPEQFPPVDAPFSSLRPGRWNGLTSRANALALVHNARAGRTLAALGLFLTDASDGGVVEGQAAVDIWHDAHVRLIAQPDRPFQAGTQYLRLTAGDLDAAFAAAQKVYALTGLTMPADMPEDATECVIYSAHAGGTVDSYFRDGRDFRSFAKRIPYLSELGFNTYWMLPFWHGPVYAPIAYDRLDGRLGKDADLKALVDTAHQHRSRVLGDLIPHGPRPESGLEKTHPEWISRDQDGNFLFMWGCYDCDYAHPGWRQFMAEHATDWVRRVGLDGYRVDVALGQQSNWRPHGQNRPGNSRVGGIGLAREVRKMMLAEKPSAVLLAEATHAGLWSAYDMMFDFPFIYSVAYKAVGMPADEFVPAMRRWLQWQRSGLPDGALMMRYVESHDTTRARLMFGPGLHQAFLGLICTIQGVPMLYDEEEIGNEPFLRRLLAARRQHRALTRGAADYLVVQTSAPAVSAVLRTLPDAAAIAATNFSGQAQEVVLQVDAARLPARLVGGAWQDALGGKVQARREGARLRLQVSLPAYATAVLVPGSAPAPPAPVASARDTVDTEGCVGHTNRHYRLLVERKTGLLRGLLSPDGMPILSRMSLREGPRKLFLGHDALDWASLPEPAFREEVVGNGRILSFTGQVTDGGGKPLLDYVLRYRVDGTATVRCELQLTARQKLDGVNGALRQTLCLPAGGEWFAQTLEGNLRGETVARHTDTQPSIGGRYWHKQPWSLWESALFPLAGSFGGRVAGGAGVALHDVTATAPGWRQNLALRGPALGATPACTAELAWLDGKQPVTLDAGRSVTLAFAATVLAAGDPAPGAVGSGTGPKLSVEGTRYRVENAHYRATVIRSQGGMLSELAPRGANSLLEGSRIYSDKGFYGDYKDPRGVAQRLSATNEGDCEAEITVSREGERLVLTVEGALRNPSSGHRTVVRPLTRTRVRYTFDSSADVGVEVSILPPMVVPDEVFLAQRLTLAGVRRWSVGEREWNAAAQSADRVWQSRETPLPAGANLRFFGDGTHLTVSDLELPKEFANLFVFDSGGGRFSLFAAPNDMTPLPERRWITFRYRLRPEVVR